jgi:hypothetical protein
MQSIYIDGRFECKIQAQSYFEEWLEYKPEQQVGVGESQQLLMCDLRCYNRALSDGDIAVIANPIYRKVLTLPLNQASAPAGPLPIEFHLLDHEQQPVLSSRSMEGQQLTLEVNNTTPGEVQLAQIPPHSTGLDRYHFILRFRKGILANIDEIKLADINLHDGWTLHRHHTDHRDERFDELCFLREVGKTLSPGNGDSCILTLENVRADEEKGTRNSRVELLYRNMLYKGESLSGYCGQTFSVVNKLPFEASEKEKKARYDELEKMHQAMMTAVDGKVSDQLKTQLVKYDQQVKDLELIAGSAKADHQQLKQIRHEIENLIKANPDQEALKHLGKVNKSISKLEAFEKNPRGPLPLHVGFYGSNTVLNDNGPGDSTSGMITTLTLKLTALGSHYGIFFGPESRLILGFDVATDDQAQAWALCDKGEATSIKPTLEGWQTPSSLVPAKPLYRWVFSREKQPDHVELKPGEALTLTIGHIRSSMPSGPTNLYISYENIYTKQHGDEGPGCYKDSQFILQVIKTPLYFDNKNVGIGTTDVASNRLTVKGKVKIDGDIKITAKNTIEFGAGLASKESSAGKIGYQIETRSLDIFGAGSTTQNRAIKFWSEGGSVFTGPVAIGGDAKVAGELHIKGDVKALGDNWLVFSTADKTRVQINPQGNVGIGLTGTATPSHRLHIAGQDAALRLQGAQVRGAGARLNFGDADYVFLEEDEDDKLTIKANRVALMGGNVGIGTKHATQKLSVAGGVNITGVVTAASFRPSNEMVHRMYPSGPKVYQDIFEAKRAGAITPSDPRPAGYNDTTYETAKWHDHHAINFGHSQSKFVEITVPEGFNTLWVRVFGNDWTVLQTYHNFRWQDRWCGGYRSINNYCPDGSLSDGHAYVHQWLPIPVKGSGIHSLRSNTAGAGGDFWLSGLAFSKNPWNHATQQAVGYYWAVNGGDKVVWDTENWNNDVVAKLMANSNFELKVPVIHSGRDKLLYLIEHNNNWNGCMHKGITVNGHPIERFTATYDNPFARHWNSKMYERYIAARIPAAWIDENDSLLDVRIDMTEQDNTIYFREIGTHDLDVPE